MSIRGWGHSAEVLNHARSRGRFKRRPWFGSASLPRHLKRCGGQRLAADGKETGQNDVRLSDMGPDGDPLYSTGLPAVASTLTGNELLVAWSGDDDRFGLLDDEFEIFGQRYEIPSGYSVFLPVILRE